MTISIHDASRRGDLETVRKFVATDPSSVDTDDAHSWRPIFHAAHRGHIDVVHFLIESGADVSAHEGSVLHYAGEVPNNKDVVALLVTHGALEALVRPNDDRSRQFFASIFLGDDRRVHAMLNRFAHLAHTVDGHGDYPLHHAARHGDTELVRLLIDFDADVNVVNNRGHTVLYCAGGHGHRDTVRLLLNSGADPTVTFTKDEMTLLEWLAQYPNDPRLEKITRLLTEHKAAS